MEVIYGRFSKGLLEENLYTVMKEYVMICCQGSYGKAFLENFGGNCKGIFQKLKKKISGRNSEGTASGVCKRVPWRISYRSRRRFQGIAEINSEGIREKFS